MLVELAVENYAVIEKVRVRFHPGLNLLTGETGSGKSIVVDALALLLGGRASAETVRSGAERARVSGIFELAREKGLQALLSEAGIETDDGELIVEREILANGKSRAFAGSRPATWATSTASTTSSSFFRPWSSGKCWTGSRRRPNWRRKPQCSTRAGGRRRRNSRNWTARRRKSCGRRTCGLFRTTKSKPSRHGPARMRSLKASAASSETWCAFRKPRARLTT